MKSINPKYKAKSKANKTIQQYVEGLAKGNRYVLSELITLSESEDISKNELVESVLSHVNRNEGCVRIAISGSPGAGKSTFIDTLGMHLIANGYKVAVLAVDPSSSVTHGSILGDKTRMENLSQANEAYIRPSAAGMTLGGVHRATRASMRLCEAAGYDVILVETVGVGQSETLAASITDVFVLLLLPGAGDDIQGIKRGIVELTDIVLVNKADEDRETLAKTTAKYYRNALGLFHHPLQTWRVPVQLMSGLSGKGVDEAWSTISSFIEESKKTQYFMQKRTKQDLSWIDQFVLYLMRQMFSNNENLSNRLATVKKQYSEGSLSVDQAIASMRSDLKKSFAK